MKFRDIKDPPNIPMASEFPIYNINSLNVYYKTEQALLTPFDPKLKYASLVIRVWGRTLQICIKHFSKRYKLLFLEDLLWQIS
jgi:hypothetical protein